MCSDTSSNCCNTSVDIIEICVTPIVKPTNEIKASDVADQPYLLLLPLVIYQNQ